MESLNYFKFYTGHLQHKQKAFLQVISNRKQTALQRRKKRQMSSDKWQEYLHHNLIKKREGNISKRYFTRTLIPQVISSKNRNTNVCLDLLMNL